MSVDELIKQLRMIKKVHPEAQVVESRTILGRKTGRVVIRLRHNTILIEGDKEPT